MKFTSVKDLLSLFYENYDEASNENFLVVAPTGSGKTHLAKSLLLTRRKVVVYVSPLKALSREVYLDVMDKRKGVVYADSEVYENDLRAFDGEVLLATYEKFDSAIRHRYKWLKDVSMVIIDEVHNVEGDRGIPIESIVAWAKSNSVPIIALSATLPDVEKYSKWINAKVIEVKRRSVPLHECVAYPFVLRCFDNGFDTELDVPNLSNSKLAVLLGVVSYVTGILNKNCLVFVKSRASTEQLKNTLMKFGVHAEAYHSGLAYDVKKKVVEDFKGGKLSVLISTTALGQGVNLPVFSTIFYDTVLPTVDDKGNFTGWRDLDPMEFRQIAGRAGRPSYDKEGMAVIVTDTVVKAERFWEKFFLSKMKDGDKRGKTENLVLGIISWSGKISREGLRKTIGETLKFKDETTKLEEYLKKLSDLGLIKENKEVSLSDLGIAVSMSYIDVDSIRGLDLEGKEEIVKTISNAPDVIASLRGCKESETLIRNWASGENIDNLCPKLSYKDVEEVISNARWISFAYFRLLKALGNPKYEEAWRFHISLKNGFPYEYRGISKLGLDRGTAIEIIKKSKCEDEIDVCVMMGSPPFRGMMVSKGFSEVCKKVYGEYPVVYDMMKCVEEYREKKVSRNEIIRKYGMDSYEELKRRGFIIEIDKNTCEVHDSRQERKGVEKQEER